MEISSFEVASGLARLCCATSVSQVCFWPVKLFRMEVLGEWHELYLVPPRVQSGSAPKVASDQVLQRLLSGVFV